MLPELSSCLKGLHWMTEQKMLNISTHTETLPGYSYTLSIFRLCTVGCEPCSSGIPVLSQDPGVGHGEISELHTE